MTERYRIGRFQRSMGEPNSTDPQEVERLREELRSLRTWCTTLEQQQAQLAAALTLLAGPAWPSLLSRFPLTPALAGLTNQLPVHRHE